MLALMALPTNVLPQTPLFVNMISLLLSSSNEAVPQTSNAARAGVATSPAQIADSMIRSMLDNLSSTSLSTSSVPPADQRDDRLATPDGAATREQLTTAAAPSKQSTDSMIQSMLVGLASAPPAEPSSGDIQIRDAQKQLRSADDLPILPTHLTKVIPSQMANPVTEILGVSAEASISLLPSPTATAATTMDDLAIPVAADPQMRLGNFADLQTPIVAALAQTPGMTIQPMPDDVSVRSTKPMPSTGSTAIPWNDNDVAVPVSTNVSKQLRSVADLPILATIAATLPALATSAPTSATQCLPTTHNPSSNVIDAAATLQLTARAPSAMFGKGEVAFTATLRPTAPPSTTDASRQPVTSPDAKGNTSNLSFSATNHPSNPAFSQSGQSQAAVQAAGKDSDESQAGGEMQQGGDPPSQQQDDSTGTPERTIPWADAKARPADINQDEGGTATALHDRAMDTLPGTSLPSFPEQARAAVPTQSQMTAVAPTPFQSTAETLRTSEPNLTVAPQLRAGAAQEIAIRIAQPDASPIDLRVVERSGQLHVDVRTSDAAMQTSLRQDLGTLTNSLERAGYHSETFTPASTPGRTASSTQMSNQGDRQDQSQNRGGSGDFSGGRRQQQQQKRPSSWLGELEDQQ
jgi:hypothetical protein